MCDVASSRHFDMLVYVKCATHTFVYACMRICVFVCVSMQYIKLSACIKNTTSSFTIFMLLLQLLSLSLLLLLLLVYFYLCTVFAATKHMFGICMSVCQARVYVCCLVPFKSNKNTQRATHQLRLRVPEKLLWHCTLFCANFFLLVFYF